MLHILPTDDKKLLNDLSQQIFSLPFDIGVGYVFYKDTIPVGFAKLDIGDTSTIISIGVLPKYRKKGKGDFFTRSILFRLSQISKEIVIKYHSDYFLKFGFQKIGDGMVIASDKLMFERECCC